MRERLFLLLAVAGSMALYMCAADAVDQQQNGAESPLAEAQYANRPKHHPDYAKEPTASYYPTYKDHEPPKGDYEYRREPYSPTRPDYPPTGPRPDYSRGYDHPEGPAYPHYPPRQPPSDECFINELTPAGDWPRHLKLRLTGTPVKEAMNMTMAQTLDMNAGDNERHGAVNKMYDMWCQVPCDPPYGEALAVGHLGHFHVRYQPAHFQKPWRLWGQTVLRIGRITNFTLAHLSDDADESICATFFNEQTIITPANPLPIYNMLIKPRYPVNMQYVLSGERKFPIPMAQTAASPETAAAAMTASTGAAAYETAAAASAAAAAAAAGGDGNYPKAAAGKAEPGRVVVEEARECKVAQVIWGKVSITTVVDGETLSYTGTLHAIPELDESSSMPGMPGMRRRGGDSTATEQEQVIAAMCGDEAVKEVVPWVWEFDLWRT